MFVDNDPISGWNYLQKKGSETFVSQYSSGNAKANRKLLISKRKRKSTNENGSYIKQEAKMAFVFQWIKLFKLLHIITWIYTVALKYYGPQLLWRPGDVGKSLIFRPPDFSAYLDTNTPSSRTLIIVFVFLNEGQQKTIQTIEAALNSKATFAMLA